MIPIMAASASAGFAETPMPSAFYFSRPPCAGCLGCLSRGTRFCLRIKSQNTEMDNMNLSGWTKLQF